MGRKYVRMVKTTPPERGSLERLVNRTCTGKDKAKNATSKTLALAAKEVVFNGFVGFGRVPRHFFCVFRADAVRPGELVVDLDEIIVSLNGGVGLDAAEEVHHSLLKLLFVAWDIAAAKEC